MSDNTCVCCGAQIPEGGQVCPDCSKRILGNVRLQAAEKIMEAVCDVCHWPYQYRNEDAEVLYAEKCVICKASKRVKEVLEEVLPCEA